MSKTSNIINLRKWIIERQKRGISSSGSGGFHVKIKEFTDRDFDGVLDCLATPTRDNRKLARAVGWLLCQTPPSSKIGLWRVYGGYAKEKLIESLARATGLDREARELVSETLYELRFLTPHPALETVARVCFGRKYCSLERLKLKKKWAESDPPSWNSVFSRSEDDEDGHPRFYVRGSRKELCGYDGYLGTHPRLNEILEFLGGNSKHNWVGYDSPCNVANYEYIDYYDPDYQEIDNRLEIYAGNYLGYLKPQGAWVVGFRLFRDLIKHLGLKPPRRLKGEAASPQDTSALSKVTPRASCLAGGEVTGNSAASSRGRLDWTPPE